MGYTKNRNFYRVPSINFLRPRSVMVILNLSESLAKPLVMAKREHHAVIKVGIFTVGTLSKQRSTAFHQHPHGVVDDVDHREVPVPSVQIVKKERGRHKLWALPSLPLSSLSLPSPSPPLLLPPLPPASSFPPPPSPPLNS